MSEGSFKITVLRDGRIKLETGRFGEDAIHTSAEGFLAEVIKLAGAGPLDVTYEGKPAEDHHHHHGDGEAHVHA